MMFLFNPAIHPTCQTWPWANSMNGVMAPSAAAVTTVHQITGDLRDFPDASSGTIVA
ncbi:Uncharacterised protein [Mycobacterium tuberculosis]|nr:Uncharacterised protein [Mycobacterium tuberculosis]CKS04633.1 Uncharacterised protein [Mycobacterium tuberculosis]CKX09287.1 Uncharacterised protein [Mycobacterium tuberculosis]CNU73574.1 Uncharacterised protein [Mycobacterium tuberculosis]CNV21884.1 Uncharacterised protein [Mycobacterium tuberculosis]